MNLGKIKTLSEELVTHGCDLLEVLTKMLKELSVKVPTFTIPALLLEILTLDVHILDKLLADKIDSNSRNELVNVLIDQI